MNLTQAQAAVNNANSNCPEQYFDVGFYEYCALIGSEGFINRNGNVYYYADGSKLNSFCGSIKII
tara:strand:+ start:161 stop:355 length:195 start_codon:yes stop_codon:yes gene_type:complete